VVRLLEAAEDIWDDVLDTHFPDDCGCIAVLRAYVDASTREDSGLLTVAAYLFESGRVRRFRQEWRDTFGTERFSWADLISRGKPFRHLRGKEHDAEHSKLVAAGVEMLREYTIAGSLASIWIDDVKNHAPTWIKGFGHAYSVAGHMALSGMGNWATRNNYKGGIAYLIEAGDDGYDQLDHLLSYASKSKDVAEFYQWYGHSTIPKTPCAPFHAPDLFAWEWGKYWTETVVAQKRLMRLSLANLFMGKLHNYTVMHLYGDALLRFFNQIHALGVEQLQENRAALSSVPETDLSGYVSEQTAPDEGQQ
jgi:hypothetical protein